MKFKELKEKIYKFRVQGGLIGVIIILILAKPTLFSILIGGLISIFGLILRGWAAGHIEKEKEITDSGPYRYIRHPLYLGNFILGIGLSVSSYSLWAILIFLFYFTIFYPVAISIETERLRKLFPEKYKIYEKNVPLIFPFLKNKKSNNSKKFNFKLYKKNREYRALFGAIVIWIILIIKYLLK